MCSTRLPLALFAIALATFAAAWANSPTPGAPADAAAARAPARRSLGLSHGARLRGRVHRQPTVPAEAPVIYGDNAGFRVALTFDDGPHYLYTPKLLETLARHGAKATFFINGYWLEPHQPKSVRARAVLARIHAEGHTIGNHTYHHRLLSKLTAEQQSFEILANERVIEGITGRRPRLFRPPYGVMTDHSRALIARQGYAVDARWNATSHDEQKPAKQIAREVVSWLIHHQGGIILLHDTQKESVEAVDLILAKLGRINRHRSREKRPNFKVVSLDDLLRSTARFTAAARPPSGDVEVEAFLASRSPSPLSKRSVVRYVGPSPNFRARGAAPPAARRRDGRAAMFQSGRGGPGRTGKDGPTKRYRIGTPRRVARSGP